jgi:curved DNA-binding protein CbpA
LDPAESNHYAALGLDRNCTLAQIRAAYRVLAKQHHPDLNQSSDTATARTRTLNAAYEILSDPDRRAAYDREFAAPKISPAKNREVKIQRNLSQDVPLPLEDFLRGARREVRINDPANPNGAEIYRIGHSAGDAARHAFRLPRSETFAGGFVQLRVKPLPNFRFKSARFGFAL